MNDVVFLGAPAFPEAARDALGNAQLRRNLRKATGIIRDKRAAAVGELDDWEALRDAGAALKRRTSRHLDTYLLQLEAAVTDAGGTVHWAADAAAANRIVADLVHAAGAREVVKVKSMATQEIGLNEALAAEGVAAYETDLAELIVQLAGDRPSHILFPAVHRNRAEIRTVFRRAMADYGRPAPAGLSDHPAALADAARGHLREKFLRAGVAISGANFAVAETGTVGVVESEGNGRMCLTLPHTLITVMGIEKVVPAFTDLEVFLQLLPRSATGERMNPYTSLWTGTTPGDGPERFHLVLLDNGRTHTLADQVGRQALACIRCSACLNVCPVYERTGGHAYGSVYPGPIGAVLTPQLAGADTDGGGTGQLNAAAASLPFASTLCGACYDACPVKIDIPEVLVHLRAKVVADKRSHRLLPTVEGAAMKSSAMVMSSPGRLRAAQRLARIGGRLLERRGVIRRIPGPGRAWSDARDSPVPPAMSFRSWWSENRGQASRSENAPELDGRHTDQDQDRNLDRGRDR